MKNACTVFLNVLSFVVCSARVVYGAPDEDLIVKQILEARGNLATVLELGEKEIDPASPLQPPDPAVLAWMKRLQLLSVELAQKREPVERSQIVDIDIPARATPELEEFLLERARIANEQIALENTLIDGPAEVRLKAMVQWHEENAARVIKQQQLAEQIGNSTRFTGGVVSAAPSIPASASAPLKELLKRRHALWIERLQEEERIQSLAPDAQEAAKVDLQERQAATMTTLMKTRHKEQTDNQTEK